MAKAHINPETLEVGRCSAQVKCPFGGASGQENHYPTLKMARAEAERRLSEKEEPFAIKTSTKDSVNEQAESNVEKVANPRFAQMDDMQKLIAAVHATDPEDLDYLAHASDYKVQNNVVRNIFTGSKTLDYLARNVVSEYGEIFASIAEHRNASAETLEFLSDTSAIPIKFNVARNKNASVATLRKLLKDRDDIVKVAAARNPNMPAKYLNKFSKNVIKEKRTFASTLTDADDLRLLSKEKDLQTQINLAENPNTPSDVLEYLAKNASAGNYHQVHKKISLRSDISQKALEILAESINREVRNNVITHPKVSEKALNIMVNGEVLDYELKLKIARHQRTSADTIAKLLQDDLQMVREAARQAPNARMKDILASMERDTEN